MADGHAQRGPAAALEAGFAHRAAQRSAWLTAGTILLIGTVMVAVSQGVNDLGLGQVAQILLRDLVPAGQFADVTVIQEKIVWHLRLPRVAMAVVGGAGLAVTGVMMQAITRNPLVSPFTIGLSPAAAFGASLAILFGALEAGFVGKYLTVGGAFLSSLLCAALVLLIAGLRAVSATTIILAGIGLTYLFSALTATIQFVATEEQLAAIVHWTFGSVNAAGWDEVMVASLLLVVAVPVFLNLAWVMNAIGAGDETAQSLGYNLRRVRLTTAVLSVLVTSGIIAFTGVIGFVGLVAPHMARLIIGNDHRWLIPFSMIVGALLLLVADTLGRSVFAPAVIPVGIVVAYVGVPLFVHLILRQRQVAGP